MTHVTPAPMRAERTAFLLSALAAIFWGSNFEATRIVLIDLPPWTAAAGRFGIATVAILLLLHFSEGVDLRVLFGMAISLFGVALSVGAFTGARFASGDLLILAGSVAWALYTIGCRRLVTGATPLACAAWTMFFGALVLVIVACAVETPLHSYAGASAAAWGASLWMALLGSALAYLFWQTGISVRGPAATSVLFNLVPVSALFIAAAFGRIPALTQVLGVAVAISGILLASGWLLPRR